MQALIYYLTLPVLYGISLLPFPLLYLLSDFMYFWIYRVLGYRKKVVRTNLKNSFPAKSEQEIIAIEKKFYEWFCDLMLETLKTLTVGRATMKSRVQFQDKDLFERFKEEGRSVIIVMGHFGNWELAGARFAVEDLHQLFVIYHPLSNRHFDKLVYHMRTRLGNGLYPMRDVIRGMLGDRDKLTATAFIADQTPSPHNAYWTEFLHQDTPIFTGTERIAQKLDYPVVYISVERPSRGHYTIRGEVLVADPKNTKEGEISEIHTRRLERDINKRPEIWLWTHRRWKHKRPAGS